MAADVSARHLTSFLETGRATWRCASPPRFRCERRTTCFPRRGFDAEFGDEATAAVYSAQP
ncbi:MAG: hypothetical protein U0326_20610 [Polyangiales bacterium]